MNLLPKKKIIYGCDGYSTADAPYLTRWSLLRLFGYEVYLHKFHRSDSQDFHDHPWSYLSVILSGGYTEFFKPLHPDLGLPDVSRTCMQFRRVGSIKYYPQRHLHRIVLNGVTAGVANPCWTLVFRGRVARKWSFYDVTKKQFEDWQTYFKNKGC